MSTQDWYSLNDPRECISPSLLVYPDRIEHNIREMIKIAGGPDRLRPHVKTHKMAEIIRLQMDFGIRKFKCATMAEAELLGQCNAPDVLLAYQPVGANLPRFLKLIQAYPHTSFSTILDDPGIARQMNAGAVRNALQIDVYLDINVGMDRTGIKPGRRAEELYKFMNTQPQLRNRGFHVYDGHLRQRRPEVRTRACNSAFSEVLNLKEQLLEQGIAVPGIVAGGSPTFPIHALREEVETSPGTTLLWDEGYHTLFPDMNFLPAAVLFCRIISKPGPGLLCLDLGHKAIAAEMPFPRLRILGMEAYSEQSQSEEHLVISCPSSHLYRTGDPCYAIPMHICPTVAKYPLACIVEKGNIVGSWKVAARDHKITI